MAEGAPLAPDDPPLASSEIAGPGRAVLAQEIWLVLLLSLGASALYAALALAGDLARRAPLRNQPAVVNGSAVANHWLDLLYQMTGIGLALVPVALVVHLLQRGGERARDIGLDDDRPGREVLWGVGLAAVVGGAGLGVYLGAYHLGVSARVVPTTLPAVWWRTPVLLLAALENALLEEVVVCGYLLHRLRQLDWGSNRALGTSAALRGVYHLYQGLGGFIGNLAMGLLFGRLYQRNGRLVRLVVAHWAIDAVAFVGYAYLHGHVRWLP